MLMFKKYLLLVLFVFSTQAMAHIETQSNIETQRNNFTLKAGTLGLGVDYIYGVNTNSNLRFNVNGLTGDETLDELDETDLDFDASFDLESIGMIYDYHPLGGVFRFSTGVYYNNSNIGVTVIPNSDDSSSYTFNGNKYNASQVGVVNGNIGFEEVAPYVGLGFGLSPQGSGGVGLSLDIGALYTDYTANLSNTGCRLGTSSACKNLASDVAAEKAKLQDELDDVKWYPVVSVGLSYKF